MDVSKLTRLRDELRVKPGTRIDLSRFDPADARGWSEEAAEAETQQQMERLADLQDRLWAEAKHGVLVVLQGIDASGKDGTIRRVMTAFNPQGCTVSAFKVPTPEELAHDYLWRVHKKVPGKGEIGIFNRSHYEDVLVVRVHEIVPKEVWSKRYDQIREFEQLLTATGTTIVKFFLYIDRDEQRERFQERLDNPRKRWKFSMADLDERKLWDRYIEAFEDALSKTSTDDAPWYVVPSNRNWLRNLAVSSILAETMDDLKPSYPPEPDLPKDLKVE